MRILQFVTRRQKRGAEISAEILSRELIKRGHFILWLGLYEPHEDLIYIDDAINIDLNATENCIISVRHLKKLRDIIKKYDIDVVQANGSDTLKYAVLGTPLGVPIIYRNISFISYWIGQNYFKKLIYRFLTTRLKYVVSVSEKAAIDFCITFNFKYKNVHVIRRGILFKENDKLKARLKINSEFNFNVANKIILWVGSFSSEKNPLRALDIFRKVNEKLPETILLYVGKGNMLNRLRVESEKIGQVYFAGFRNNIDDFLAGADILLLTSEIEGVPGVVLEAASQNTIAVAGNVGGVSEAIIHDQTGILLDKLDIDGFASSIVSLLQDNNRRFEMGRNANKYVYENYFIKKSITKFEQLYQGLT